MASISTKMENGVIYVEYQENGYTRNLNHSYLVYTSKPLEGYIPMAGYEICRSYAGNQKNTKEQWKKEKQTFVNNYKDLKTGESKTSLPFNYKLLTDSIRKKGFFYPDEFNLPNNVCTWLDCATNMKVTFHKQVSGGNKPWLNFSESSLIEHYGEDFPIKPLLQREGHLFSTLLPSLLERISKKRHHIITNSNKAFSDEWIFEIKDVIIDCISLIDITLNSLYIKAQYKPHPKWTFNEDKLGSRISQRLNDKLSWVYKITGNTLNIESEKNTLEHFKVMRNHFNHFDPPCFVITLEEIADILNGIMEIGMILIKMRQAMGTILSVGLINFILHKKIVFVSEPEFIARTNRSGEDGYYTSSW